MICSKCGNQIPDDAKFCGNCGNSTATENATPVQPQETTGEKTTDNVVTESVTQTDNTNVDNQQTTETNNYNDGFQQQAQNTNNYNGGFQQQAQNTNSYNGNFQQQEANASKTGLIMLGGIAVAVIVVIVLLFNLLFGGSYEDPVDDLISYLNDHDTDYEDLVKLSYGKAYGEYTLKQTELMAEIQDTDMDEIEEYAVESLEDVYDQFEDQVGDDWKIEYEIKRAKELSKSKLEDYQEEWEDRVDSIDDMIDYVEDNDSYDEDDIDELVDFYTDWVDKLEDMEVKEGYTLKVKLSVEGDDGDVTETSEMVVLNIDGDWTMWNGGFLDSLY